MKGKKKFDFSGYATKVDILCADGRTIRKDAFKHQDGAVVPLVWQHLHNDPGNVLGHAYLEHRDDGVYAYGIFNNTEAGKNAKELVEHGDISSLSIHANDLKQQGKNVLHGVIRELSLVMAGANPGARIENISLAHADGSETDLDDEAIIYSADTLSHGEDIEHAADEKTVEDVLNTLNEEQKEVVYAILAQALEHSAEEDGDDTITHSGGKKEMKNNIFDGDKENKQVNTLTHAQFQEILATATANGGSLKAAVLQHATTYGIENIDVLFPDAQALARDPQWLKREDDWVSFVLGAIHKSPFSRVKTVFADMDFDAARAKGYIKATEKKEVYFKASKRVVTPTTVYVKQKLDRDDMIDVVDFDVVAMIRFQLRTLLDEELALSALLGDGRDVADPYKINESNIIPVWTDEELFTVKETLTTKTDYKAMIKQIALTHKNYKGTGMPVLYTTSDVHTNMLWVEDTTGRRIYESDATLCAALRVKAIVEVPPMEGKFRMEGLNKHDLIAIKVNLADYNFGADKGGQVASFDDFDIDFNQYKYLMETRCSGALTKPYSAQVYEFVTAG